MHRSRRRLSLVAAVLACCVAVGCGSNPGIGGGSAGAGRGGGGSAESGASGALGSGGTSGTGGGVAGASGTSGGAAGASGTSGGGSEGTAGGGGTAAAGTGGGGDTGGGGATGGAGATAGAGATGGAGGTPAKAPARPSAGCGEPTPETGSSTSPLTVADHQYYVKLPSSYDASKPYPVIFVFNGTGDRIYWGEQFAGFESAARVAIRVYPHPIGASTGWSAADVSFFMPLYDQITSQLCVDTARVFAAGSDSGGNFASVLGCEYASVLRGVALSGTREPRAGTPDAAYPLDATMRACTGQVTAIVIHGVMDKIVGPQHGPTTRDFYRARNHCATETELVPRYSNTVQNCVRYQGCDDGFPVYWCQHSDPTYADTYHGWPSFASGLTWSVFSAY